MLRIDIPLADLARSLAAMTSHLANPAPLMRAVAGCLEDAVEKNFARQGRPSWAPLKPNPRRAGGRILQDSGQLAASIVSTYDARSATVGSNKVYAAIQQFGGRTRPHVIRPRYKKALAFNGRVVKSVNHPGSVIPARPFLTLAKGDERAILREVGAFLRSMPTG